MADPEGVTTMIRRFSFKQANSHLIAAAVAISALAIMPWPWWARVLASVPVALLATAAVSLLWTPPGDMPKAERAWTLTVERGQRRRRALPLRWAFGAFAPTTLATGGELAP